MRDSVGTASPSHHIHRCGVQQLCQSDFGHSNGAICLLCHIFPLPEHTALNLAGSCNLAKNKVLMPCTLIWLQIYAFSRDRALPLSSWWHRVNPHTRSPLTSIWLALLLAFLMGLPSLANATALGALFSLTATGLYCSYLIPILLRVTVARKTFAQPAEFNLGRWSVPAGIFSVCWAAFMVVIVCLPQQSTVQTANTLNYSPVMLGGVLVFAWAWWIISARHWFKGAEVDLLLLESLKDEASSGSGNSPEKSACNVNLHVKTAGAGEVRVVDKYLVTERSMPTSCGVIELDSVALDVFHMKSRSSAHRRHSEENTCGYH